MTQQKLPEGLVDQLVALADAPERATQGSFTRKLAARPSNTPVRFRDIIADRDLYRLAKATISQWHQNDWEAFDKNGRYLFAELPHGTLTLPKAVAAELAVTEKLLERFAQGEIELNKEQAADLELLAKELRSPKLFKLLVRTLGSSFLLYDESFAGLQILPGEITRPDLAPTEMLAVRMPNKTPEEQRDRLKSYFSPESERGATLRKALRMRLFDEVASQSALSH